MLYHHVPLGWGFILLLLTTATGAQNEQESVRLTAVAGAVGTMHCETNTWSLIRNSASNPTDQPVNLLMSTRFDAWPNVQFASRLWLPPHARRHVITPVRPGKVVKQNVLGLPVTVLLLNDSGSTELEIDREQGLLRFQHDNNTTGFLDDDDEVRPLANAVRLSTSLPKRMSSMRPLELPATLAQWQVIDRLIISHQSVDLDGFESQALRNWLMAGGMVWIMLDRVPVSLAAQLLGEDWRVEPIDRIHLTEYSIKGDRKPTIQSFDYPVEMVRVTADRVRVHHMINGWPASFEWSVGLGRVMVTTLEARGWLAPGNMPTTAVHSLARQFNTTPSLPQLNTQNFEPYLAGRIGYQVIERGMVIVILGGLCIGLLGLGAWLARQHQLEWLAAWGTGCIVLTAAALLIIGWTHQHKTPSTIATAQFVQVVPSQQSSVVSSIYHFYSPKAVDTRANPMRGKGETLVPDGLEKSSSLKRLVWSDLDQWSWQNLELEQGQVRSARGIHVVEFNEPIEVTVSFDQNGPTGSIATGSYRHFHDPILATSTGCMAVSMINEQRFIIGEKDELPTGQFIAAAKLNDRQRGHRYVYEQLLSGSKYPDSPVLLGWTKAIDPGMEFWPVKDRIDSALVAIPVQFERPPAGTRIRIPAAFLPFASVKGPQGIHRAVIYDEAKKEWNRNIQRPIQMLFRFKLPKAIMPLRCEQAKIRVTIQAPGRSLELFGVENNRLRTLSSFDSPTHAVLAELNDSSALQPDEEGGIRIGVRVTDSHTPATNHAWTIEGLQMEIAGQVLPYPRRTTRE